LKNLMDRSYLPRAWKHRGGDEKKGGRCREKTVSSEEKRRRIARCPRRDCIVSGEKIVRSLPRGGGYLLSGKKGNKALKKDDFGREGGRGMPSVESGGGSKGDRLGKVRKICRSPSNESVTLSSGETGSEGKRHFNEERRNKIVKPNKGEMGDNQKPPVT